MQYNNYFECMVQVKSKHCAKIGLLFLNRVTKFSSKPCGEISLTLDWWQCLDFTWTTNNYNPWMIQLSITCNHKEFQFNNNTCYYILLWLLQVLPNPIKISIDFNSTDACSYWLLHVHVCTMLERTLIIGTRVVDLSIICNGVFGNCMHGDPWTCPTESYN